VALPAASRKFSALPRFPVLIRAGALALLVAVAGAIGLYLYMHESAPPVAPPDPVLGGKLTAIMENYRHLQTEGGKDKYLITAALDKWYENGSHELSTVEFVLFGATAEAKDRINSDLCTYNPANAIVLFTSNVKVDTADGLHLESDMLRYNMETRVIEIESAVKFSRPNLDGTCKGAIAETAEQRLKLLHDVDMTFHSEDKSKAENPLQPSAAAQAAATPAADKPAKKGGKKGGGKKKGGGGKKKKKAAEAGNQMASDGGAIDFANGPKIPVRVRAATANFDKQAGTAHYAGNAVVTRAQDELRGDDLVAHLTEANRIERVDARGNAYLRASGRAEATAPSMQFFFAEANQLKQAIGVDGTHLHWLGEPPARDLTANRVTLDMQPGEQGAELHHALAEGQSVVTMAAPATTDRVPNPAARELRADKVEISMFPGGQFMKKADADGNAVLTVTPVKAVAGADRRRLTAQRMHLTFFDEGSLAREMTADGGIKAEFEPLAQDGRLPRTTTSETGRADFDKATQDITRLDQAGEFKYVEGDRNAVSGRASYVVADDFVALRDASSSGRPTVWDSKSRSQADEIDMHPNAQTNQGRGDVRTTYYNTSTTASNGGKSVPFGNTKSPVFFTAQRLDTRQTDGGVAVFTGQARGWQDDNYVKADLLRLFDASKRMEAEGNVESALYQIKRKDEKNGVAVVPVFTTASKMTYSDVEQKVHYEGGVTSRQAPDVISSNTQDVWLTQGEKAEVDHMFADGDVVSVEPGRKGTGDRLVYTAADQKCVLTGSNARVEDSVQGTSTGQELTYFIGGDRIQSTGQGAGRVKTTRKIRRKEAP